MSATVADPTLLCVEVREEEELDEMEELRVYEDDDLYPKGDVLQVAASTLSMHVDFIDEVDETDNKNTANETTTNLLSNVTDEGYSNTEEIVHTNDHEDISKSKKKKWGVIDSDSESDSEDRTKMCLYDTEIEREKTVDLSPPTRKQAKSALSSFESDDEEPTQSSKMKSRLSNLVDSDSASDLSNEEGTGQHAPYPAVESDSEYKEKKRTKPMRASAKKALDEMQTIQSEQQRLHREAHISIPYHKPKRHTLQDFLKRRTIIKPQQQNEGCSPLAMLKTKSLKMTPTELEEYAKLMEARAMEATEFFKSEEEEKEMGVNLTIDESVLTQELTAEHEDNSPTDPIHQTEAVVMTDVVAPMEQCQNVDRATPSKPKVIITEIIELPKLDLSTVTITPPRDNVPKRKETLKRLIMENRLSDSPSLQGDSNMLIDLDTGDLVAKRPSGVDNLLQRLMSTNKARRAKTSETVNILSTENGKLEMSTLNVHIADESDASRNHKPGEAYFKLKENLKSIITKKRVEEIQKRQEEENEHKRCLDEDYYIESEDEEQENDKDDTDSETNLTNEDKKFNDIVIDDEENALNLDDQEDTDDTSSDDDKEEGKDDDEEKPENDVEDGDCKESENNKPRTRILQVFADDSDDEMDLLRTSAQMDARNIVPVFDQLQDSSAHDENELLALCSGQFEETQKINTPLISQIPITQLNNAHNDTDELIQLCSGTFEENMDSGRVISMRKIESQKSLKSETVPTVQQIHKQMFSSDDEADEAKSSYDRNKKLTKKITKSRMKLGFSDDEEEEESITDLTLPHLDVPVSYIDYDSEENEIVVKMTKEECVKQAGKFFEQEAELSESDWGSADEDEQNMDKYDIELGDEDEFDRDKLRTELGQIHARKMLDEDIREVRKIQEMLFEDAETDGVGRQRQFKWKNAENGFNLDDSNRQQLDEPGESGDEENEQLWRKIRFEREQLLREQGFKMDSANSPIVSSSFSSTCVLSSPAVSSVAIKKINIITSIKRSSVGEKDSPFLISKDTTALQQKKKVRDSFLMRDRETLTKLAGLTKIGGGISEEAGTAGTVSVKAIKSKNFVFATLTEEEHENKKRKADDLLNSSSEIGVNYIKKPKVGPRRDACLIDQLL